MFFLKDTLFLMKRKLSLGFSFVEYALYKRMASRNIILCAPFSFIMEVFPHLSLLQAKFGLHEHMHTSLRIIYSAVKPEKKRISEMLI